LVAKRYTWSVWYGCGYVGQVKNYSVTELKTVKVSKTETKTSVKQAQVISYENNVYVYKEKKCLLDCRLFE